MYGWKNSLYEEKIAENNINLQNFQALGFKTYLYNIFRDLKSHWLYDASVIWRLVWKWLRRDRKKERWVSCLPDHSLAVAGHRPDVGAPHWSIEASINRSVVGGHL